ncbi:DUF935 family protein [Rhizobium ruizarguesonis]|uniref:DUF935 domain-containing protein n=1 Tax=Rhizobium ruizarguesonis TaxID=2081791 RepID=UPI0010317CE5|nr:DUF935 family protein [Rhizobium ruizarguesonis]TBB88265.1 DUF935 family protein [Rhizobium ruizarguesonis]
MAAVPQVPEFATVQSDPYIPQFQGILQPTDETLRNRAGGKGVALYDEIRKDPHAFAILQKRKLEVVSREWQVTEASTRRLDKKAAEEVQRQLKALNLDRLTSGLMGAVLKGYAVAEIIWENIGGVWTARKVKVKKQRRFRFNADSELRMLTRSNSHDGEPVPERKFIVHRHSIDDDDDDPYGVGIGSVLYWPAWFKRQTLAYWLRATEKYAAPTTKAQYEGNYDKKRQDELTAALSRMANDTTIVVPENVQLDLLEATRGGGGDLFEALNRYLDELMSEAVLGETLSTNSGERGARSLGEIHNEVRVAIAKADSDLLSGTLKETLVRWIVELNFPGAGIPELWRDFSEAEDLNDKVERDKTIFEMGYEPKDESYINETYGGEWVKKAKAETPPGDQPAATTANLDFADNPITTRRNGDVVTEELADQLETSGAPAIERMIEAIRTEFTEATSYDDLVERLARLSAEMGIDDLASIMEQGVTLGRLEGIVSANG